MILMLGQLLNQPSLPAMQHVSHDLRVAGFARDFNSVDALSHELVQPRFVGSLLVLAGDRFAFLSITAHAD